MDASPTSDNTTASWAGALERAKKCGLRVARLNDTFWLAESSDPAARAPYMLYLNPGDDFRCECPAGRHETVCLHRAAVRAAAEGAYPISPSPSIRRPVPPPELRKE